MVLAATIEWTFHELTIDSLINATSAAGMDGIPDGYGADGLPCTADDTTANPGYAAIAVTTGSASATMFDANMVPSASCPAAPGKVVSTDVGGPPFANCAGAPSVGVVAANACRNLSIGVGTGYQLVAAFPVTDGPTSGDTATSGRVTLH